MNRLTTRADWLLLAAIVPVLILFKAWLTYFAGIEIHYDEAQYWEWSQQLDWSYYSKGPLIAWLIALSDALFGHGVWQVRLFGWLFHCIFLVLIFAFAYQVWHDRITAWWAFAIALLSPLYFTLGLVMTTDNLLFVFWTWGLWATYRAVIEEKPYAWYEAGAAAGLGVLTKLSIGLLPAFVGLWIIFNPAWRHHLKSPHLWSGLLLMFVLMSPVFIWNANHNWVMFRHELGHIENTRPSITRALEFMVGQILVLSPIITIVAIPKLWRKPRAENQLFLWALGICWVAFFILKAVGSKEQVNWPAPSYIGLLILFSGFISSFSETKRRILYSGFAVSIVLMIIIYFPQTIGLSAKEFAPIRKVRGWQESIRYISEQVPDAQFVLTTTYPLAAELAFYWNRKIPVYITGDSARRFTQHDLWPSINREAGHTALFVNDKPQLPPELDKAFSKCTSLKPVISEDQFGTALRTLYPALCTNYQIIDWPRPQFY